MNSDRYSSIEQILQSVFDPVTQSLKFSADTITITTLQQAYDSSNSTEITVNAINGAVTIQDANSTINGSILDIVKSSTSGYILRVQSDGRIHVPNIHNNANTHDTTQEISSGTYTPTLINISNVTNLSANGFNWMRVGNIIQVNGSITITPTLAISTNTRIGISLPISSNLASLNDCNGMGVAKNNVTQASQPAAIFGDTTNKRAEVNFYSLLALTGFTLLVSFQYEIK